MLNPIPVLCVVLRKSHSEKKVLWNIDMASVFEVRLVYMNKDSMSDQ